MNCSSANLIKFLTTTLALFLLFAIQANAAAPFDTTMCNITNIVTGNAGKAFAAFAVISLGVGFFSGKISLGLLVASSIGVSSIFAAPTMVSVLSGKDAYECVEGATYVTDCGVDGICYSCPAGHVGADCSCPTGFTGDACNECISGYSPIDGTCKLDCNVTGIEGIVDTTVQNGIDTLSCNTNSNYEGSIDYSCNNNNFSITGGSCTCSGNYAGVGCLSCKTGYQGADCDECASDYTQISDGSCAADCHVSGVVGIVDGTLALPLSGSLTCSSPYNGNINYTCVDGGFSSADICSSSASCSGGNESTISVSGVTYKVHKFTSVGTFNFRCTGNKNVEYLVVAGGGGGGSSGGGGGAGGFLQGSTSVIDGMDYSIVVGDGGAGSIGDGYHAIKGGDSSFGFIATASGGGWGGDIYESGGGGGSGGGSGGESSGGSGISGQGNKGGNSSNSNTSGGGGAGDAASNAGSFATNGGAGKSSSITGTTLWYAGGGGGGSYTSAFQALGGSGVGGSGGFAIRINTTNGSNAVSNTGGGGGGGGSISIGGNGWIDGVGGNGGSGIVVIRYVVN